LHNASITLLVNNAGIGASVPTWQADNDQMEQMIDVNIIALTRLAYLYWGRGSRKTLNPM
jgi:hypothetical protein